LTRKSFMETNWIRVKVIDLPCTVHGMVMSDTDGGYLILINARDSRVRQNLSLDHELRHIVLNQVSDPLYAEY